MIALFQKISEVVPTRGQWCEGDKANRLAAIVLALKPSVTVEIGVYLGGSFLPMALAHKHLGHGVVVGIDPWSNAAAEEGYEGDNRKWWGNVVDLEAIYQDFIKCVHLLGVDNVTDIRRAKSDDVEPPPIIDVLHVDGQHTEQAVRDVRRFGSKVRIGGVVVMDDTDWANGEDRPVRRAEQWLIDNGFSMLYTLGTGAVYERVK